MGAAFAARFGLLRLTRRSQREQRGAGAAMQALFPAKEAGFDWLRVKLEGELATRIPLRIVYLPTVTSPGNPPHPLSPQS